MTESTARAVPQAGDERTLARLVEIERSLERYGCFDLVEEDVAWLIERLREELGRRGTATRGRASHRQRKRRRATA
jgi:hypothetical protein